MNISKIGVVSFSSANKLKPVANEMTKLMEKLSVDERILAEKNCKQIVKNAHFNTTVNAEANVNRLIKEVTVYGHKARNADLKEAFNVIG